jgi:flagellar biosynthesis/type III secretory pathway protein FliH
MSSKARLVPGTGAPCDPWFLSPEVTQYDHDPAAEDHLPAVSPEETAFTRGVAEGRRLAASEAAAELDHMKAALWSALASAAEARTHVLAQAHHQLVEVAVAMARHIVRRHVEYETAIVATMAEAAIQSLQGAGGLRVCLNPLDHARLVAAGDPSHAAATWTVDPSVERGGCRVFSTFGEVDAGVEAQLAELSRALFDDNDVTRAP